MHFSQPAPTVVPNFLEKEKHYATKHRIKGELVTQPYGRPSKNYSFCSDVTFELVYLHLVLSSFLSDSDLNSLNQCYPLFGHLCNIISKIKLSYIYDLFEYDLNYKEQSAIPPKRKLQYLFLALMHRLHIPSMIRSLKGNQTTAFRDPEAILQKCEPALPPDLLQRLKSVLYNENPAKFHGHTTVAERAEYRNYGNHATITKNKPLVDKAINKEEQNKWIIVLPSWLERFIPHLYLSPQGLIIKESKKDRLVFDGSFLVNPHSKCVNSFTTRNNEIPLKFQFAFPNYLKRIYNLRITYPTTELATIEDNVSGAYRHCKLHPDVSAANTFIIDHILFLPLGYVFGSNVINFRWEIIVQARSLLSEHYQSRSDVQNLVTKHSNLLDKIQFPPDMFQCAGYLIPARADSINKGVINDGIEAPTENNMYVDDNLLVDT